MKIIVILFLVTIVILNNSLVMATLERVGEFGTLRAIGAQKGFVNAMVVFETAVLGSIAGIGGALAGVAFVAWLHQVGIPAPADVFLGMRRGIRASQEASVGRLVLIEHFLAERCQGLNLGPIAAIAAVAARAIHCVGANHPRRDDSSR